jgi:hypothetical protein
LATIKILGDAAVVTSTLKVSDIKKLITFSPKSLDLVDAETKEPIFGVRLGLANGSLNAHGVTYNGENARGFATATLFIPVGTTKKKDYITEIYGNAILTLNKAEESIIAATATVEADIAAINGAITVEG